VADEYQYGIDCQLMDGLHTPVETHVHNHQLKMNDIDIEVFSTSACRSSLQDTGVLRSTHTIKSSSSTPNNKRFFKDMAKH
jgi:hypothetical protein